MLQGGYLLAFSLVYIVSCVSTELLLQLPGSGCQGNLSPTLLAALHSSWGVFFVSWNFILRVIGLYGLCFCTDMQIYMCSFIIIYIFLNALKRERSFTWRCNLSPLLFHTAALVTFIILPCYNTRPWSTGTVTSLNCCHSRLLYLLDVPFNDITTVLFPANVSAKLSEMSCLWQKDL